MAGFVAGALVEIFGVGPPPELTQEQKDEGLVSVDINGQQGQLVEYDAESKMWSCATFFGMMVNLGEEHLKALPAEVFSHFDIVLGPRSDLDLAAMEVVDKLETRGYSRLRLNVGELTCKSLLEATESLEEEGWFGLLAPEFQEGYLGKNGQGSTATLDFDTAPDNVFTAGFAGISDDISLLTSHMKNPVKQLLGFDMEGRTKLMLRRPHRASLEQPPPADSAEALEFLHTMRRSKLLVLLFVGPSTGTVTLTSRDWFGKTRPEVNIEVTSCEMLMVHTEQFDWSFEAPEGEDWLVLQTWCLDRPMFFDLTDVTGADSLGGRVLTNIFGMPPEGPTTVVSSMYCRFPADATGWEKYWIMFGRAGADTPGEMRPDRWDMQLYYDPECDDGSKSYSKHHSAYEGIELFDNKFFNISVSEARGIDPVHRNFLEVTYACLAHTGRTMELLRRKAADIGVFAGNDHYEWGGLNAGADDASGAGGAPCMLANRCSYVLNIRGPSLAIDTACSSSLTACHVGRCALLDHQSYQPLEGVISGGVQLIMSPYTFIGNCAAGMLTHMGRCFTFNQSADGFCRAEGISCIFQEIETYDDTKHYAIIAGTCGNQDGRSASLTAPSGPSQTLCIQGAQRNANRQPFEVDISECHGTGTALGDPIEVGAVTRAFFPARAAKRTDVFIFGSIKSNNGHAEGGAGNMGIMKCILMCCHQEGCQVMHLNNLNPHLDLMGYPCMIATEQTVTKGDSCMAGVSGFGFGGSNGHVLAWNKNIMTSRGKGAAGIEDAFKDKLNLLKPPEVVTDGPWQDWTTEGLDPSGRLGKKWEIIMDHDEQSYKMVPVEEPETSDVYYLRGSHNEWASEEMRAEGEGHYVGELTLGDKGEAEFQIGADAEGATVCHPGMHRCARKSALVLGPEEKSKEKASWLVKGSAGEKFTVELQRSSGRCSVVWVRA